MPWALLSLLLGAPDCEPWLVAQVERARLRAGGPPLTLTCPEPSVVVVANAASRAVRLSGFGPGDGWVGTALIALVEAQARIGAPTPSAGVPTPGASAPLAESRSSDGRIRVMLRPTMTVLGPPAQLGIGADALLDLGGFRVGAGVGRHQASVAGGSLAATDVLLVFSVPLALWRGEENFVLVLEPGVAAGATRLAGEAVADAKVSAAWAPAARAWVGLGLEAGGWPLGLELVVGVRGGIRVAPAGTADGVEVLAGTAPWAGAVLGIGWSR
jgi:hypothetical protein